MRGGGHDGADGADGDDGEEEESGGEDVGTKRYEKGRRKGEKEGRGRKVPSSLLRTTSPIVLMVHNPSPSLLPSLLPPTLIPSATVV